MTTVEVDFVVFDADYTLFDPRPGRRAALGELFSEYRIDEPVEKYEAELAARSAGNILSELRKQGAFGSTELAELRKHFIDLEGELVSATVLCPGALDALHGSLSANAVATRSPTALLIRRLQAGLDNASKLTDTHDPHVDTKVAAVSAMLADQAAAGENSRIVAANCSASGRGKPFPDPVVAAFENLARAQGRAYDPSRSLMIGDSNEDACAGLLAGAVTVRSRFSDGVLGDVYDIPREIREHFTVADLTHIRLQTDGEVIMLTTDAAKNEMTADDVRRIVQERLGIDTLDPNASWPVLKGQEGLAANASGVARRPPASFVGRPPAR